MKVTIVDETIHLIKLNIYTKDDSKPFKLYIEGYISEPTILEMEKYIESCITKGSGAFEAATKFLKDKGFIYHKNL